MILFYSVFGFLLFIYILLLIAIIVFINIWFRFDKDNHFRDNGIIPNKERDKEILFITRYKNRG